METKNISLINISAAVTASIIAIQSKSIESIILAILLWVASMIFAYRFRHEMD